MFEIALNQLLILNQSLDLEHIFQLLLIRA